MPNFIERNFDSPARPGLAARAGPRRSCASAASASWRRRSAPLLRRRAAAPHLHLPGDVRRAGALRGPGPLRRHHLHGHRQRRVHPRGRHARAPGGAGRGGRARPGVEFRYDTPVERILLRRGHRGPRHRRAAGGRRARRRRRRRVPTPTCRSPTARCSPGIAAAAAARRGRLLALGASSGTSACAAPCPPGAAHHNIHFGARLGRRLPRAARATGVRMPDPSLLVTVPTVRRARHGAAAARHVALRARAGAEPRRPRRLERRARPGPRRPRRPRSAALGYPTDIEVERAGRPARLGGAGHGAGHAVRAARTRSSRPARSAPATSSAGRRAWCSSARAPCPASACRWCCVSGGWPRERVQRDASAVG